MLFENDLMILKKGKIIKSENFKIKDMDILVYCDYFYYKTCVYRYEQYFDNDFNLVEHRLINIKPKKKLKLLFYI